jgi:Lon protease-like protein
VWQRLEQNEGTPELNSDFEQSLAKVAESSDKLGLGALAALLRQLERSADAAAFALRAPDRWDDCGWLANRWCELLPIDAPSKQRLMAMDGPLLRLELVADTLRQMGLARPGA